MKYQLFIINHRIRMGRVARPHPSPSLPGSCPSLLYGPVWPPVQGALLRMSIWLATLWARPSVFLLPSR